MSFLSTHAQDFLNAYEILRESNELLVHQRTGSAEKVSSSAAYGSRPAMGIDIVCLAFSVELHLKELHRVVEGKIPRGHNIAKLFKALPTSVRKEVVSHHSIVKFGWSEAQLECELISISDGFEKWRYAHESSVLRYNVYFAKILIEAIKAYSLSRS
ncbi:hypothetical protein K8B33_14680 [Alcanivorax sp. JB21]|uniref:hypothetical protein n=1 Tax=Alcanivorax limicola TaxID=2874102 RepID=UPI001CC1243A|nr:hypothetical protein [Alcanivorax limicola]MBZ2190353.1 hypothetical protein [Alcanivorax limicola]